jgi:hypothetical protein
MSHRKLAVLVAAAVTGVALIAAPALAQMRAAGGGGGMRAAAGGMHVGGGFRGGGFGGMRAAAVGGGFRGGGGFARGFSGRIGGGPIGFARPAAFRTSAFALARTPVIVNRPIFRRSVFVRRPFFRHRFFARAAFIGFPLYAGYSCWRWVPTAFGVRRIWVCDYPYASYGASYYY